MIVASVESQWWNTQIASTTSRCEIHYMLHAFYIILCNDDERVHSCQFFSTKKQSEMSKKSCNNSNINSCHCVWLDNLFSLGIFLVKDYYLKVFNTLLNVNI